MPTIYLDTETTGLGAGHDLVEIAIVGEDGVPLLNTLVRPRSLTSWPEAQRIHGIRPEQVATAPTLPELEPLLVHLFTGADLVVYNAAFDMGFMSERVRAAPASVSCCMLDFAAFVGEWNEYRQSFRWQKLDAAARHVGYTWEGEAHRALADARACRAVWLYMLDQRGKDLEQMEREESEFGKLPSTLEV